MNGRSEVEQEHERITLMEFARRVHRTRKTIYRWLREPGKMPAGSVLWVSGHVEIDWTVFKASIRAIN